MDIEESVGLQSAHIMRCQGSVKTLSCEVTVSKVIGHWPVCRTTLMPDRLITLSPIAQLEPAQMASKGKQSSVLRAKTSL